MKIVEAVRSLMRKQLHFDIMLATLLVVMSILLNNYKVLQRWDNLFYDVESSIIQRPVDDDIVIVMIDDMSLQKLGRWPWSRAIHARLIDQLTETGVTAIGLDILFMEQDLMLPEGDKLLAEAIQRNGHVVLPVLTNIEENDMVVTKSLMQITDAAQLAHVNMSLDEQGVVRQLDLEITLNNGQDLPSMALALHQKKHGHTTFVDRAIQEKVFIAFSNPPGQFQQTSYVDVLLDSSLRQSLKGKIVLIGVTAAGLDSSLATPGLGSRQTRLMSGVVFQANALNTLEMETMILPLKKYQCWLISIMLIIIPVMTYRFFKPSLTLFLAIGFSLLTCLISFFLLSLFKLWFAPLSTLLCLVFSYPLWSLRKVNQLKSSLFKEQENASAILKAIADSVVVIDKQGEVEYMNPAAEKMLAYSLTDAKSLVFSEIYEVVEKNNALMLYDKKVVGHDREHKQSVVQVIRNRLNEEFFVRFSSREVYAENGSSEGVVYAFSDLTEVIEVNKEIAFIATHDTLTRLPNRTLLRNLMEQAIKKANRERGGFSVLFIDLDGFKKINDGMGHASGDLLLQEVATRLRNQVRESDTISRWGGDEFIIMLDKLISPSDVASVAEQMKQNLSQIFMINQQEVFITASIGISLFPEDGKKVDVLLEKADTAMYNIKKSGRNNVCFYSQSLETQAKERLFLENELRQALKKEEFDIYYQPQFDLSSNQLIGLEALIRWKHLKKGLLTPDQFISLAEESGLIVPIGHWVIKTVCRQLKLWKDKELPLVKVAINISARQFAQKDLVTTFVQEVESSGVEASLLQVEITESMMIQDMDIAVNVMERLKSVGISIAIDDFGTGYSSLEYLRKLPIDKLKIDKSFIASVVNNQDDASIVQAVIAMGRNMNIQIIAEGVETEEQLHFLLEQKCEYAQGFFFSKPIPAEKIEEWIRNPKL
ncbi:MAG: EAL domain-containing protein [Methylococcales bacterium]|nr:EAL domain-containing protein [Methylococcales bacterium]